MDAVPVTALNYLRKIRETTFRQDPFVKSPAQLSFMQREQFRHSIEFQTHKTNINQMYNSRVQRTPHFSRGQPTPKPDPPSSPQSLWQPSSRRKQRLRPKSPPTNMIDMAFGIKKPLISKLHGKAADDLFGESVHTENSAKETESTIYLQEISPLQKITKIAYDNQMIINKVRPFTTQLSPIEQSNVITSYFCEPVPLRHKVVRSRNRTVINELVVNSNKITLASRESQLSQEKPRNPIIETDLIQTETGTPWVSNTVPVPTPSNEPAPQVQEHRFKIKVPSFAPARVFVDYHRESVLGTKKHKSILKEPGQMIKQLDWSKLQSGKTSEIASVKLRCEFYIKSNKP